MLLPRLKPTLKTLDVRTVKHQAPTADTWRAGKTSTQRGYGYEWQKARSRFLREHPLCEYCKREGRLTQATVVDHVVPHQGDQSKFWDEANWQALCAPCHSSVKAKEEGRGV